MGIEGPVTIHNRNRTILRNLPFNDGFKTEFGRFSFGGNVDGIENRGIL
jgi:hypothetical protein